jgi:hypothetical protein
MLRLVQSVPSPNAEPFKLWLAKVGYERLEETADPELAILRALKTYLSKGYSLNWINQRLKSIEIRKDLTDQWKLHNVEEGVQYATLTDIIYQQWTGKSAKEMLAILESRMNNSPEKELIIAADEQAKITQIRLEKMIS